MSTAGGPGDDERIMGAAKDLTEITRQLCEQSLDSAQTADRLDRVEAGLGLESTREESGPPLSPAAEHAAEDFVSLDSLLSAERVARLERRYLGGFAPSHRIDRWDLTAACFAGVVGGAVDILLVGIPKDVPYAGVEYAQGPLPGLLKTWQVDSDNWLARCAKVAYDDFLAGTKVPGMGGRTHRLLTPGHDPLLGLVVGVFDVIFGSRTALSKAGDFSREVGLAPGESLPAAVALQILHLLSDVATPMGLPAPGWTLTPLLQFGSFGPNDRTAADLARYMYFNGYDFRHFVASLSSPLAIELVLFSYFAGRRYLDREYDLDCEAEEDLEGGKRRHPRYKSMRLIADALACAANAGKVTLIYQGNPLALNYAQWLALTRSSISYLADRLESTTDIEVTRALRNERVLEDEWETLYAKLLRDSQAVGEITPMNSAEETLPPG